MITGGSLRLQMGGLLCTASLAVMESVYWVMLWREHLQHMCSYLESVCYFELVIQYRAQPQVTSSI
jgi:hypothetical protein